MYKNGGGDVSVSERIIMTERKSRKIAKAALIKSAE
jgi:hypothetical protein